MSDQHAVDPDPRRRDARQNTERILAAARDAFATTGDVSMAEVARRAGVGSATLYRNFPDRWALLEALYADEITALVAAAATPAGQTSLDRLRHWLRQLYDYFTSKQALADELLKHTGPDGAVFSGGYARVSAAAAPLIDAAHRSGELREELSLEHVFALIGAVGSIHGDALFRAPLLEAALDSLAKPGLLQVRLRPER